MAAFQTVLIAADLTQHSPAVLRAGLSVARAFHARTVLVHVVDSGRLPIIEAYPYYYGRASRSLVEEVHDRARAALTEFLACHGEADAALEAELATGDPAEQILALAAALKADLIVLGGSRAGRIGRLGGTAYKVVRRAACSVLSVSRHGADDAAARP